MPTRTRDRGPVRDRTLFAIGAGFLVVVLTLFYWLVDPFGRLNSTAAQPQPAAPAPAPAIESACGLPGTAGEGTGGATAATWTDVAGWSLPTSASDGPGRRDKRGPWSCFTRTPSGAVLAAYVIPMRIGGLADDWQAVVREQTVPGPGRDVLLASVPNSQEVETPRGFSIAAYSPESATVRYRLDAASGSYACTTDVRWSGGDWRLVVGDDGSTSSGCVRGVPDTFTPWGP